MKPYFQDEACTIWLGDCREILPAIPKADAVITDPPYGVGLRDWDEPPIQDDLDMCLDTAAVVMWFGAAPPRCMKNILSLNPLCDRTFIWNNTFTGTASDGAFWHYQPIYVWGKTKDLKSDVIEYSCNGEPKLHPAQKPEGLMRVLILSMVSEGMTIIDPWMGSGTTLRAAKNLNIKSVGIERQECFAEIAAKRLSQEVFQW